MKYEYCQVALDRNEKKKTRIIAYSRLPYADEDFIISEGRSYIQVFNQLGEYGWKMCGYEGKESIFYFMREVKDV